MRALLLSLICGLFSPILHASYFEGCGTYIVRGVLDLKGRQAVIKVFEGSRSETNLVVKGKSFTSLMPYRGSEVEVSGLITKEVIAYNGTIKINHIEYSTPNPTAPEAGQGLWINKRTSCE